MSGESTTLYVPYVAPAKGSEDDSDEHKKRCVEYISANARALKCRLLEYVVSTMPEHRLEEQYYSLLVRVIAAAGGNPDFQVYIEDTMMFYTHVAALEHDEDNIRRTLIIGMIVAGYFASGDSLKKAECLDLTAFCAGTESIVDKLPCVLVNK